MPLPVDDVELVRAFVTALNADMPPHVASQLRYRLDTDRNALTIVECRAVDPQKPAGDWFEVLVSRLRFTRSRGWELYWPDWHLDTATLNSRRRHADASVSSRVTPPAS